MIPIFTSDYSIGKSILKFRPVKTEGGADSIVEIAKENNFKKVVMLENKMHGFLDILRFCETSDIDFIYGLQIPIVNSIEDKKSYKVNLFALNDDGVKLLYKIHSFCYSPDRPGKLMIKDLKKYYCQDCLMMAIPFYDSFIYYNNFTFDSFVPDFSGFGRLTFFVQRNNLPIDSLLEEKVRLSAKDMGGDVKLVKSIYYKNKSDFEAYQVRKIIHHRKGAKTNSLSAPNLEGCSSDEFCIESWLEHDKKTIQV